MGELDRTKGLKILARRRVLTLVMAMAFALALTAGTVQAQIKARQNEEQSRAQARSLTEIQTAQVPKHPRRFFDKTNLMLFAGVAAVRTLDYTSTQHFRSLGDNEVLLTNSIVDNKPLFAGIEAAGTALSIGVSYLFYRTGHYKLERWVSIIHISVGAFGDVRNYSLGPPRQTE